MKHSYKTEQALQRQMMQCTSRTRA